MGTDRKREGVGKSVLSARLDGDDDDDIFKIRIANIVFFKVHVRSHFSLKNWIRKEY